MLDITNQRFGRLVAKWPAGINAGHHVYWLCLCDCGTVKAIASDHLTNGDTKSCGCLRRKLSAERETKHGHKKRGQVTRTYHTWYSMKSRCHNPNTNRYSNYGGRGITVCKRWLVFENFLEDMGERPLGTSIDRYPNNGGNYEKQNCRWATSKEQRANQRSRTKTELPLAA
jgi:hypothetical protein